MSFFPDGRPADPAYGPLRLRGGKFLLTHPDSGALPEEDRQKLPPARAAAEEIAATFRITEITGPGAASVTGILAGLRTTDMNGNAMDASLFTRADLTILNVWDTTCTPCIAEMPALAAWAKELPENVQLVELVMDVTDSSGRTFANAKKSLDKSGVTFVNRALTLLRLSFSLFQQKKNPANEMLFAGLLHGFYAFVS